MLEAFYLRYGLATLDNYKLSPLVIQSKLSQAETVEGSRYHELVIEFLRLKIFNELGISFEQYMLLSSDRRYVIKLALDVVQKEGREAADKIMQGKPI